MEAGGSSWTEGARGRENTGMRGEFLSFSRVMGLRYGSDVNLGLAARGRDHESELSQRLKLGHGPETLESFRLPNLIKGKELFGILSCGISISAKPDFVFLSITRGKVTSAHLIEVKLRSDPRGIDLLQGMFDLRAAEVDRGFGPDIGDLIFCYGKIFETVVLTRRQIEGMDKYFEELCISAAAMLGWVQEETSPGLKQEESLWGRVFEANTSPLPKLKPIENPADRFYEAFEKIISQR